MRFLITTEGQKWLRRHEKENGAITYFLKEAKKIHDKDFESVDKIKEWIKNNIDMKNCDTGLDKEELDRLNYNSLTTFEGLWKRWKMVMVLNIQDDKILFNSDEIKMIMDYYIQLSGLNLQLKRKIEAKNFMVQENENEEIPLEHCKIIGDIDV